MCTWRWATLWLTRLLMADEGALRFHGYLDGSGKELGVSEERADQLRRQIAEGLVMPARDQETMPRKERALIEERKRYLVFENDLRLNFARDDCAERAVHSLTSL